MLIIKCNMLLKQEALQRMAKSIAETAAAGAVVIPTYCTLLDEMPTPDEIVVIAREKVMEAEG